MGERAYAAVAANISTLVPEVINERAMEKIAVNTPTMTSRMGMSVMKYRTTIEQIGISDEIKVPTMLAIR
jgi:hypothetical protein